MVEHDDIGAGLARRLYGRDAVGAAIDRDDEPGTARDQLAHGVGVGTIALEDAVGNVDFRRHREMRQETLEQRRGGRAVHVVVAEDRHLLAPHDSLGDAVRGLFHVGQRGRVGQEVANGGVEEAWRLECGDAAPGQHAGDDVGQAVALRDGKGRHVLPLGKPVGPCHAGRRAANIQKEAFLPVMPGAVRESSSTDG